MEDPYLLVGERLAGCRVELALARGAMGMVYRARRDDGRVVALKVLHPTAAKDAPLRARFLREGQALMRLPAHPNLVRVFAAGQEGERPYILMEFVEGVSLQARLDLQFRFEPLQAAGIARDLAEGLAAVHEAGLVHRDLKPANAVLGADGRARIVDFGIVQDEMQATLSSPDQLVGSLHYMAPERWEGEPVDARCDLFALGVTVYQLLVGKPPFRGRNPLQIADRAAQGEYDPPSKLVGDVPPELERVLAQLLMPELRFRYASARHCAEDLERVLAGQTARVPALVLLDAEGRPDQRIPLLPAWELSLGSDPACELYLDGPGVAPRHAKLRRSPRGFLLQPAPAASCQVAGEALTRARLLASGERIRLGERELVFWERGPEPEAPAPPEVLRGLL